MKAVWVYRFRLVDGRVVEADVVRVRTAPYTQIQVDLYVLSEARRRSSQSYRNLPEALLGMRLGVKQIGRVAAEELVSARRYEPEDSALLFSYTRDHVARWCAAARAHVRPALHEASWAEIGSELEAVNVKALGISGSEPLVEAYRLLLHIVEKLTDILIWEVRQHRVVQLDPAITPRRTYTRTAQSVVANLEVLKHLAPFYGVAPALTGQRHAEVIDMFAWKRARSHSG